MFDEVTKKEGGRRAARRVRYLLGSSAVQVAIVAGIISLSAALSAQVTEGPLVPVKIVKSAPPPPPPRPPPPPPPKAKSAPKVKPDKPRPPTPTSLIQPKEVPLELKEPDKGPPEEMDEGGEEGGVVGGVVGGVTGGGAPPPKPAAPVKFNSTMTAPVLVSAPPLEYTQQALEREVEGVMIVECLVRVDGTVHRCRVLKSLPFMDRNVVENLERRRYKPATQGGNPLDVEYTFTVRLKLPN